MTVVNWRLKRLADFLFWMSDCFGLVMMLEKEEKSMGVAKEVHAEFGIVASGIQNGLFQKISTPPPLPMDNTELGT